MRLSSLRSLIPLLLAATIAGCGLLPEQVDRTEGWSASKLYSEAKDNLNSGNYETAIKYFETLEARYPFGRYAQQAQLEVGYAYYKHDEPEAAIAAMDRFIKMHPRHPHVDYAWYLKGLTNFNRGRTLVDKFLPRDLSERDPGSTRQAYDDFKELVERFPQSRYAGDAAQRMVYLRNNLAEHELKVADFYVRRGAYVAAAGRAKTIVEDYQGTPAVPEALALMADVYERMALPELRADALRVLRMNYPDHPALARRAADGE